MSINKVFLSGNLTKDAELKKVTNGNSVLEFSIAVNKREKSQSGEWIDKPSFFDCSLWGARAEALSERLTKGTKVCVEGQLNQRTWTAQDGTKRSKISVSVKEIEAYFLAKNDEKKSENYGKNAAQTQLPSAFADDDIPF